jgi:hypothetical protein
VHGPQKTRSSTRTRIEELRREIDELRDIVRRLGEWEEDYLGCLERWKETFDMVEDEDGKWG